MKRRYLFIFSTVILVIMFGSTFYLETKIKPVPCDGIEEIANMDFFIGVKYLKNQQTDVPTNKVLVPEQLINGEPSDCETLAHTIACHAEQKGIDYRYLVTPKHLGIEIFNQGEWVKVS